MNKVWKTLYRSPEITTINLTARRCVCQVTSADLIKAYASGILDGGDDFENIEDLFNNW